MFKRIKFLKLINITKKNCEKTSLYNITKKNSFKNVRDSFEFVILEIY